MNPISYFLEEVGSCIILLLQSLKFLPTLMRQKMRVIDHSCNIGYMTFPIVGILSFFIGAVLALQAGYSLSKWEGAQQYLGSIVGLSMCRELGPVMTAFLLAGRVGSAITAELASMTVYSEVDALITMNVPPTRILVLPRLVAAALMMPMLTILSVVIGWFGGMIVCQYVSFISLNPASYWDSLKSFVDTSSVSDGLIKAEIFGLVITLICCNTGLRTKGGPREIGTSVTHGVVFSMISILLLDYFITKILM